MELIKLTNSIYYLPHNPEVDRPMLAYIKGKKFSLAIDAGYSKSHVHDFYNAIKECGFNKPNFTIITHWRYDHTFGMHATSGVTIAHKKTNYFLRKQRNNAYDEGYIEFLKKEDIHFSKEYADVNEINIVLSDIEFSKDLNIDLGNLSEYVFHTVSPHSDDTTCVYIPKEKVLFLGDSTSEDFFNNDYMDKKKLESLIKTIETFVNNLCSNEPPVRQA